MHELLVPILILCFIVAAIWSLKNEDDSIKNLKIYDDDNNLIDGTVPGNHLDRELKSLGATGYLLLFLKNVIVSLKYIVPILVIYAILKILC